MPTNPTQPTGCAPAALSVAEGLTDAEQLLAKWKADLAKRDREVQEAQWLCSPLGIEQRLGLVSADLSMTMWYFNKLIAVVAANEKRVPTDTLRAEHNGKDAL